MKPVFYLEARKSCNIFLFRAQDTSKKIPTSQETEYCLRDIFLHDLQVANSAKFRRHFAVDGVWTRNPPGHHSEGRSKHLLLSLPHLSTWPWTSCRLPQQPQWWVFQIFRHTTTVLSTPSSKSYPNRIIPVHCNTATARHQRQPSAPVSKSHLH